MRLRARLVTTLVAVALPVGLVATAYELRRERDRAAELVAAEVRSRAEVAGREACEDDPSRFPAPPALEEDWLFGDAYDLPSDPRYRLFVYDAALVPFREDAPGLPAAARAAFARGRAHAFATHAEERVLVPLPFGSQRCAAAVLVRPRQPGASLRSRLGVTFLVVFAVVVAGLVSAGPVVARLVRLRRAVETGDLGAAPVGRDEIAELTAAFRAREATIESQLATLEARERALREHLAATSHDLLLPMTVLKGHLAALRDAPGDEGALRGALEEGHYLEALVRDLNAEARLSTGQLSLADVDLTALVERVRDRHAPIAKAGGRHFEAAVPERPLVVRGDPTLLEQLVSNLVHNALRHGCDGGHVALTLDETSEGFSMRVLDDNEGVDDALVARLGERGFRADAARTRSPEGLGLGLHVAREVAARHGFTLTFAKNDPTGLSVSLSGTRGSVGAP